MFALQRLLSYDADVGRFTAPWIMGLVDSRVVYRSNALLGDR